MNIFGDKEKKIESKDYDSTTRAGCLFTLLFLGLIIAGITIHKKIYWILAGLTLVVIIIIRKMKKFRE